MAVGPHELLKLVEKIYHDQGWTESVHVCDKPVFHDLSSVDLDPWRQKLSAVPSGTEECLEKEEEEDGVGSGAEMEDDSLREEEEEEEEEEVADNELSEGEKVDCCWLFLGPSLLCYLLAEVVSLPSLERAKEGVLTIGTVGT